MSTGKRLNSHGKRFCTQQDTFGKHSKPPPVTLSNANEDILCGTMAANLQAIIAPTRNYLVNS